MTEPVIAQKKPCVVELEAGISYWWCACGRSANQPFCDGSHEGTGLNQWNLRCRKAKNTVCAPVNTPKMRRSVMQLIVIWNKA